MEIPVYENLLKANDVIAGQLRSLFRQHRLSVINLLGSPGSGKTTLLEVTINRLRREYRVGVVEGDLATTRDAQRIAAVGAPVVQVNTRGGCHLDALMVQQALPQLPLDALDLIFIDNVGNLVCTSGFDLGESAKVVVLSVTEGDDKPAKYPPIFVQAQAVVISKIDLLPYVRFSVAAARSEIERVHPGIPVFELSAESGAGLEAWLHWVRGQHGAA